MTDETNLPERDSQNLPQQGDPAPSTEQAADNDKLLNALKSERDAEVGELSSSRSGTIYG